MHLDTQRNRGVLRNALYKFKTYLLTYLLLIKESVSAHFHLPMTRRQFEDQKNSANLSLQADESADRTTPISALV